MKWIFIVNNSSFFPEFFAKLAGQAIEQGDECLIAMNSKIVEFTKKKVFPDKAKIISRVDWCVENYKSDRKEFGDLSWKELFPTFDRYKPSGFFNYNNSFNIISQTHQFFEFLFQQEKPDAIIGEPPAGLFHEIAYSFCRKNNIPYFGLGSSRFEGRLDIYDLEFTFSKYEKTFKEIKDTDISEKEKKFVQNFIQKFISHENLPSYFKLGIAGSYLTQFNIFTYYIKRIIKEVPFLLSCFLKIKNFKNFDYETEIALRYALVTPWRAERRKIRTLFQKNIFSKTSNSDIFFFYPLQGPPEASTSIWATYYSDQLSTIKNIAFALPFPYKLYIKEHPGCIGLRPGSFYKKLKELPNAVLISPHENVGQIVKKSSAVITLTGTIGMEAALAGKITYVLGNVSYFYHPLCQKIKNFEELKDKIKNDLINKPSVDNLEDINCRFIVSCFRNTIKGSIISVGQKEDINDYKLIYLSLKKYAISKLP
ncbi:MAG: hypothetical protein AAB529_00090 [Patescibacteria group bacterium]